MYKSCDHHALKKCHALLSRMQMICITTGMRAKFIQCYRYQLISNATLTRMNIPVVLEGAVVFIATALVTENLTNVPVVTVAVEGLEVAVR